MAERRLKIIVDQDGSAAEGVSGLSSALGGLVNPAALAVTAIAGIGAAGFTATSFLVGLGSSAEEMEGKFNIVFGSSAPAATAALDEFGNAVGRNKFDLMGMAASLQDTFVPLGFARDKAADMSVQVAELAVDIGSFNNVAEETVASDLQSALTGQTEVMKKYGVVINQAAIEQEALNLGLTTGKEPLDAQTKAAATLSLIMKGTSDAQGDAARTSGSWANQMRGLKAELMEAATTMGKELLPVVTPLLKDFGEWVKGVMPVAIQVFKDFTAGLVSGTGPTIKELWNAIRGLIGALKDAGVGGFLLDTVMLNITNTGAVVIKVIQGISFVINTITAAFNAIRDAISYVTEGFRQFADVVNWAASSIPQIFRPGSPTPFEIGIRGIGQATDETGSKLTSAFGGIGGGGAPPLLAGGGGAGGQNIVVQIDYHPAVSLADQNELEGAIRGAVENILRVNQVAVGL